jgi:hypothetical protein
MVAADFVVLSVLRKEYDQEPQGSVGVWDTAAPWCLVSWCPIPATRLVKVVDVQGSAVCNRARLLQGCRLQMQAGKPSLTCLG